jgi:hypothetical protein
LGRFLIWRWIRRLVTPKGHRTQTMQMG